MVHARGPPMYAHWPSLLVIHPPFAMIFVVDVFFVCLWYLMPGGVLCNDLQVAAYGAVGDGHAIVMSHSQCWSCA